MERASTDHCGELSWVRYYIRPAGQYGDRRGLKRTGRAGYFQRRSHSSRRRQAEAGEARRRPRRGNDFQAGVGVDG